MRKSVVFLLSALLTAMLGGCILSITPNANNIEIASGQQMTFSVKVYPSTATFAWSLDGTSLSDTGSSYVYTALAGGHTLIVRATHALGTDTQAWYIYGNSPPVANAGPDHLNIDLDSVSMVTLDGSGSTDPDNDIVSYQWEQTDGPIVMLTNANTAVAQFTDNNTEYSILTFELTVTDALGLQTTDTCLVYFYDFDDDPMNDLLKTMVYIPGGSFEMGSTDNTYGWAEYTTPVHTVTLRGFDISPYEVTQEQYESFMGTNPSNYQGADHENCPVEQVTWLEAWSFCIKLSAWTGRTYTLPTEAQWEYACRAGTSTVFSFGDDKTLLGDYAWYNMNAEDHPHPIGTKLPNPWGLYDMHGNVWEWCLDSMHDNYTGAPTDGSAWGPVIDASTHIFRGGGYYFVDLNCSSGSSRWWGGCSYRYPFAGFRVVALR